MNPLLLLNMPPNFGEVLLVEVAVFLAVVSLAAIAGIFSVPREHLKRRRISKTPRAIRRLVLVFGSALGLAICFLPSSMAGSVFLGRGLPFSFHTTDRSAYPIADVVLPLAGNLICGIGAASLVALASIFVRRVTPRGKSKGKLTHNETLRPGGTASGSERRAGRTTSRRRRNSKAQPN